MGKYGGKGAKFGGNERHDWRQYLRSRHPTKTALEVSARTGISADTVEKWFRLGTSPSWDAGLALISAYGAEFLAAAVPGCGWLAEAAREAQRTALDRKIAALEEERSRLLERR